jgi:hypothetical protein
MMPVRPIRESADALPCPPLQCRGRILHGLSGDMNTVRLVFAYPDLNAYEREEARDAVDPEYVRAASAMPFVEGTLVYEVYREG